MRTTTIACLLITIVASDAVAQEANRWIRTDKTLYDYISSGYELKARTDNSYVSMNVNATFVVQMFLQKGSSLVNCVSYGQPLREAYHLATGNSQFPKPVCLMLSK
jgi:hypothetical protein